MSFLKEQNLFSFMYNGKNIWDCEMRKNVREDGNKIITELLLPDGLKITNIAKTHENSAYEWVNWFENSGTEATQIISDIWDCDYVIPFEKDEPLGWVAYEPDRDKVMKVYAPSGSQWTGYEFYANPDKTVENGFQSYIFPDRSHKSYSAEGGRAAAGKNAPF